MENYLNFKFLSVFIMENIFQKVYFNGKLNLFLYV